MRLIDADRLCNTIIDEIDPISISMDGGEMRGMMRTIIAAEPTIDAVPLDRLCWWLAKFGSPCEINEDMCDQAHDVDRCIGIFNSSAFCWQYLLTKMMEEQNAAD